SATSSNPNTAPELDPNASVPSVVNPPPSLAGSLETHCHKHGLRTRHLTVCPEDQPFYERFRYAHLEWLAPDEGPERFICEQIVAHEWFLWQCDTAEAAAMRKAMTAAQRTRMGSDED